jgi:hypothetical protein
MLIAGEAIDVTDDGGRKRGSELLMTKMSEISGKGEVEICE